MTVRIRYVDEAAYLKRLDDNAREADEYERAHKIGRYAPGAAQIPDWAKPSKHTRQLTAVGAERVAAHGYKNLAHKEAARKGT